MKRNRRRTLGISLILGIVFLAIGISTDNTAFTWIAIVFVVVSFLANSRWLRSWRR